MPESVPVGEPDTAERGEEARTTVREDLAARVRAALRESPCCPVVDGHAVEAAVVAVAEWLADTHEQHTWEWLPPGNFESRLVRPSMAWLVEAVS